jgi:hypothetical protein
VRRPTQEEEGVGPLALGHLCEPPSELIGRPFRLLKAHKELLVPRRGDPKAILAQRSHLHGAARRLDGEEGRHGATLPRLGLLTGHPGDPTAKGRAAELRSRVARHADYSPPLDQRQRVSTAGQEARDTRRKAVRSRPERRK